MSGTQKNTQMGGGKDIKDFDWCNFCTYDENYDPICGRCEDRLFDTPSEFKEKDSVKAYREAMPEYERLKERDRAMVVKEVHLDEYYCPACGAENGCCDGKVEDNFCPKCGQRIDWSEEEEHEN